MPERKLWTQEEDRALRFLKEDQAIQKWSMISRRMQTQFGIMGRTGKQCRERYHNHLDKSILSQQWNEQEEEVLYRMHGEVGNKWSMMSQHLPGRTDNCVKNHFYSRLRRGVRRLNKTMSETRQSGGIKISFLYKILEICESRFKNSSKYDEDVIERCIDIKNQLYMLQGFNSKQSSQRQHQQKQHCITLMSEIQLVQSKFRRVGRTKSKEAKDSQNSISQKTGQDIATKQQECDEPFYKLFKKVCQQIIKSQPS